MEVAFLGEGDVVGYGDNNGKAWVPDDEKVVHEFLTSVRIDMWRPRPPCKRCERVGNPV